MQIKNCFRHTLVALMILFSSFAILSCKKAAEETPAFYTPEVPIVSTMKTWIADQKQFVSMGIQLRIDSLLSKVDWQKAMQTNVSNDKSILYIPIKSSELGLEFFYDNKRKAVDSGNLVKVETKNSTLTNTEIIAAKTYYETVILGKASTNPFTGVIHTYNIAANFIYDYTFDGGKKVSHSIVAPKQFYQTVKKANGLKTNAVTCEEWGLYIIWEYSPPTLVYTFLVCSGMPDCPPTSSLAVSIGGGKQYVGVNCAAPPSNSGSPAGGGVPQAESCNINSETAQNYLNSFEPESLPFIGSFEYGEEVTDSTTGGYSEKFWEPSGGYWTFFSTILPPYFELKYGAFYDGIVYRNNSNDLWKYKNIQYTFSQKVDGIVPPCLKLDVTVKDIGTIISSDKRTATSKIRWYAMLTISCLGGIEASKAKENVATANWGNPD